MFRYERDLLERQAQLRSWAAAERERLAQGIRPFRPYLELTDRALRAGRAASSHPVWIAAGVAAVVIFKPKRALRVGGKLWVAWRTLRTTRRALRNLLQRLR